MAGKKLAAAEPEVHSTMTGLRFAFAMPSAKKAALRSSRCCHILKRGSAAKVSASGAEREPGQKHTSARPARASSSVNAPTYRARMFCEFIG